MAERAQRTRPKWAVPRVEADFLIVLSSNIRKFLFKNAKHRSLKDRQPG